MYIYIEHGMRKTNNTPNLTESIQSRIMYYDISKDGVWLNVIANVMISNYRWCLVRCS